MRSIAALGLIIWGAEACAQPGEQPVEVPAHPSVRVSLVGLKWSGKQPAWISFRGGGDWKGRFQEVWANPVESLVKWRKEFPDSEVSLDFYGGLLLKPGEKGSLVVGREIPDGNLARKVCTEIQVEVRADGDYIIGVVKVHLSNARGTSDIGPSFAHRSGGVVVFHEQVVKETTKNGQEQTWGNIMVMRTDIVK